MRIAVSSLSFRAALKAGELKLSQVPAACGILGFDLVELNDGFLRTRGRTGKLLTSLGRGEHLPPPPDFSPVSLGQLETGLRVSNTQLVCFTADNDFVPARPETLAEQIRYTKAVIGAARYLDCHMVRLWLTSSRARTMDVGPSTVAAFREATETAAKAGVRLAVEHQFSHLEELEALVYVIEQVRSYHLGVCLNLGHLPPNAWRVGLTRIAPYSIHVHAQSREFDAAGNETSISYPSCIATLKKLDYKGAISIEYLGPGDPLDGIVATRTLLERSIAAVA
jgi:sugar phosphate isomerase/epimerase